MNLKELNSMLNGRSPVEDLSSIASVFPGKTVFTTSFGMEDQIITHLICSGDIPVDIVTIDTGRLFPETYKVFNETIKKYGCTIKVFFPGSEEIEKMLTDKGPLSFYYSRENRLECCHKRKVMPLRRALEGAACWISGIRAGQSENRANMESLEYDQERNLYKFYPLFDWTLDEVRSYVAGNKIPYNVLHDRGYVSIGCEPCTRAINEGEDMRAGRWWWECGSEKECGLHIK